MDARIGVSVKKGESETSKVVYIDELYLFYLKGEPVKEIVNQVSKLLLETIVAFAL